MNKRPENWGKGNTKKPFEKSQTPPFSKPFTAPKNPNEDIKPTPQGAAPAEQKTEAASPKPAAKSGFAKTPFPPKAKNPFVAPRQNAPAKAEPTLKEEPKPKAEPKPKEEPTPKVTATDKPKSKKYVIIAVLVFAVVATALCLLFVCGNNGEEPDQSQASDVIESSDLSLPESSNGSDSSDISDISDSSDISDVSSDISEPETSEPEVSEPETSEPVYDTTINNTCPECKKSVEYNDGDVWLLCFDCHVVFPGNENPIYSCNRCERSGLSVYLMKTQTECWECLYGKSYYTSCLYCNRSSEEVYIYLYGDCTFCDFNNFEGVNVCEKCDKYIQYEDKSKFGGTVCPSCARCRECYGDITPEEYLEAQAFLCKSCYDESRGIYYGECEICNAPLNLSTAQDYNGKRCRQCANCIYCGTYIWQYFYEETGDFICPTCFAEHNTPAMYEYVCRICGMKITTSTQHDKDTFVCPMCDETPNVFCPECGNSWHTTGVGVDGFYCWECGHNWTP
ncbi:MAG: hypothetical protein IKZ23_05195 [Clostridia bacterium]|nr:hypothetical protein [Clostridia bacterium]